MQTFAQARPWHERDDWEAEAGRRGLSTRERELVGAFRRDGFVIVEDPRVLDGVDVDGVWNALAPQFAADGSGRVQDAWTAHPGVRDVAVHPAVLAVLRLLYGREPLPFQTLNFLNGTEQRTHSDTIHFSSFPSGFMCGVWMAMEDITLRQGPLHYYPASQRLPELDYEHLDIPAVTGPQDWLNPNTRAAYALYEERIDAVAREGGFRKHELAIKRGSFLVWSANLLHGGSPRDDRSLTRKSQVTHYYFERTIPYTPMFSRRGEERFAVRRPRDIRTNGAIVPSLDGTAVVFPDVGDGLRGIRPVYGLRAAVTRASGYRGGLPQSPRDALALAARGVRDKLRR